MVASRVEARVVKTPPNNRVSHLWLPEGPSAGIDDPGKEGAERRVEGREAPAIA